MSEEEYISKINMFVSDMEKTRDAHDRKAESILGLTPSTERLKMIHLAKSETYNLVVKELSRTFNLINNGKETNT